MTRRTMLATAGMAVGAFALQPAVAGAALTVEEVAPGHFVHYGVHEMTAPGNLGAIANIGFVVGREAVAVIDTGGSPSVGAALLQSVRRVTDRPIRFVVNTHMHPDHLFGNGEFSGEGTRFVGHWRLESGLRARAESYLARLERELGEQELQRLELVRTDIAVQAPVTLDLGDRALELQAWPTAHTNNDLTVVDPTTGTIWTGDLVVRTRMPALDGSLLGWIEVLRELRQQTAATIVPGHGSAATSWKAAQGDLDRYLRQLKADVRSVIARFGTIGDAIETAVPQERDRWRLFDEYHGRNVTAAFAELEWS